MAKFPNANVSGSQCDITYLMDLNLTSLILHVQSIHVVPIFNIFAKLKGGRDLNKGWQMPPSPPQGIPVVLIQFACGPVSCAVYMLKMKLTEGFSIVTSQKH